MRFEWREWAALFLEGQVRSIIGAVGGALAAWFLTVIVSRFRFRRFRSVFGRSVRSADDFLISLPLWTLMDSEGPRYRRTDPQGNTYDHFGPSLMLAKEDVLGGANLIGLLSRQFNSMPRLVPDNETVHFDGKTVIFIGSPEVNFHAADLRTLLPTDRIPALFVRREFPDQALAHRDAHYHGGKRSEIIIRCQKSGNEYIRTDSSDYATVMRLQHPSAKNRETYLFVVAGIGTAGTWGACQFLANNWQTFIGKKPDCAVILRVPRTRPELITEIVETV